MIRLTGYSSRKNSLRETFIHSDQQEVFEEPTQQFQSSSSTPFLDQKVLQKLFTYEDVTIQDRVSELEKIGGLVFLMNGLKVWHETGLTRFSSFSQRQKLYGVNCETPRSLKKFIIELNKLIKTGGLITWFVVVWIVVLAIQYFFGHLQLSLHPILSITMLFVLMISKILVKNFVDSDINKSLSYSQSKSWVSVRREGRIVKIQQQKILVGDILFFFSGKVLNYSEQTIFVDGIIIKCSQGLCVDQYKTISQRFNANKTAAWNLHEGCDPFIFAGTQITYGDGQMLVCCVGQNCTFRTVSKSNGFIKKKTKYIRQGEARYIILSMKIAQFFIAVVIYFKMFFLLVEKSPLSLQDIPSIFRHFIQMLSWTLILQDMQRIQYMYCFIEKRTYQQKQFKIINKLVLGQLLKLDVLLIDQGMLQIQEQHNARQDKHTYYITNQDILSQVNTVVDIKIMTDKTIQKCRQYRLNQPYSINREIVDLKQIKSLQNSKFICHADPSYYIAFLVKAFRALNYRVGVVPINIQNKLDNKVVIISTNDSQEGVQNMSWVKLDSSTCEEGLKKLYLISTNFYILMSALMNQHFLSLVAVITGVIFIQLPIWTVLFLVVIQIFAIYANFMMISCHQSDAIETGQSFENNFLAHHLTIVPFFIYSIYSIHNPKDVALFLICRNIMSIVYNTRMGELIKPPYRRKVIFLIYTILFIILTTNLIISYVLLNDSRAALTLFVLVVSMNLIYLAEKNYNNTMRKKPHISFN